MSEILTNNKYYKDIADTIRQMKGVATTYKPREMAGALRDIYSTEVEGVPPLTFPSNGNNLLNYRINGANGGVGDRTKNLLQNTATSQTINGVTFTINSDKSITCNGTATANTIFRIIQVPDFPDNEDMLLTGCPVGGSSSTYQLQYSNNRDKAFQDMGNGIVIQKMDYNTYPNTYAQIRIVKGYTCNNLTFYPMIRLATIEDDTYEPYGYKVPLKIEGKNLWNDEIVTVAPSDKVIKNNNEYIFDLIGQSTSEVIALPFILNEDHTYTISFDAYADEGGTRLMIDGNPDSIYNDQGILDIAISISSQKQRISRTLSLLNGNTTVRFYRASGHPKATTSRIYLSNIQLEEGSTATSYEPYIEPTTTNIYLDEPIEANESKSLSDTNVNIPTINGINTLSIDTTIQPSNVYVQAPKTNNYNL